MVCVHARQNVFVYLYLNKKTEKKSLSWRSVKEFSSKPMTENLAVYFPEV